MTLTRFSKNARKVLSVAQEEAERFQHEAISTEHLLLGLMKVDGCDAQRVLHKLDITGELLTHAFTQLFPPSNHPSGHTILSTTTKRTLELAADIVRQQNSKFLSSIHLLMGLAQLKEGGANRLFQRLDVSPNVIYETALAALKDADSNPMVKTQLLATIASNQTRRTQIWNPPLVAGRVYHMERIEQILARRYHKKVLLVGYPGTGKTTIVDAIVDDFVREGRDETVWQVTYEDLVGLGVMNFAYNKHLQSLIRELEDSQHILHITDVPRMFVPGLNVISILRTLMRADIRLIQECPLDFYEEHLEDDPAVQRHFTVLMVGALPVEDTRTVLITRKAEFEAHHNVKFLDSAIEAILDHADEVLPSLYNPDQALQFMDEIGAIVASRLDFRSPINAETVTAIVRYLTGNSGS